MSFKHLQGFPFPGKPIPVLNNPFGEEIFPNTQSKPPLMQLEAVSSCPINNLLMIQSDFHHIPMDIFLTLLKGISVYLKTSRYQLMASCTTTVDVYIQY